MDKEQRLLNGCGNKTGYKWWVGEGSSPKYCGDLVQTSQDDGYYSYCRKCRKKLKRFYAKDKQNEKEKK